MFLMRICGEIVRRCCACCVPATIGRYAIVFGLLCVLWPCKAHARERHRNLMLLAVSYSCVT